MAIEKAKEFFRERGMEDRVLEFDASSATVELALSELEACTQPSSWVDVCKLP